jgi:hypothetical protein
VIEAHLRLKHKQMRESPFLFFRGTFYRWAQLWPDVCASLRDAPKVLAVGDLHVGSFGTWRDAEGRLSWGVDDFDESYPLPYTNDLVRLAASVKIVIDSEELTIRFKEGCSAILEGYEKALKAGGCPFVLTEHEKKLDRLGVEAFEPPNGFWEKLDHLRVVHHGLPRDVKRVLGKTLPDPNLEPRATTICRYCQMGRRPHRARSESHAALGKCLAGWWHRKSPVLLSEGYPVR